MAPMRTCWSCHTAAGEDDFCQVCAAIQPPDFHRNLFQLMALPVAFAVDRQTLENRYRETQQRFHPDRFVTRSATERRLSMEHITRINEAYQTLRDPLLCAQYLLQLAGVQPGEEQGQDPAFLMEVMELRESLVDISLSAPDAFSRLDHLRQQAQAREQGDIADLAADFEDYPNHSKRLRQARQHLDRLRYHRRFLEEVDRMEEGM